MLFTPFVEKHDVSGKVSDTGLPSDGEMEQILFACLGEK